MTRFAPVASRRPFGRVAVAGHSMEPGLHDGDWLIYERRAPRVGEVAIARDPRDERRWLVKRVGAVGRQELLLTSDAPGHECLFVDRAHVIGRVAFRYAGLTSLEAPRRRK